MIFDSRGRPVRQLVNNVFLGNEGTFIWDGMNTGRNKVSIGIYVILIEMVHSDGKVKHVKRAVVVSGK